MNNQITLFMEKNIDVKIALKILIQHFFKTTLQMDLKSYMKEKLTLSNFYVSNYKSL